MRSLALVSLCLMFLVTGSTVQAQKPKIQKVEISPINVLKRWTKDQEDSKREHYWEQNVTEKIFDYDTGNLKKEEKKAWGYLFFSNGLRRRDKINPPKPGDAFGFEPVKDAGIEFDEGIWDRFTFLEKIDGGEENGRKFFIIAFQAATASTTTNKPKVTVKGYDVSKIIEKIVGEIEIWEDDGTLKAVRLHLTKPANVAVWGGGVLAGGHVKELSAEITTTVVDGKVVPLTMKTRYKFNSTGIFGSIANVREYKEIDITFSNYVHMTAMQKTEFLMGKRPL